MIADPSEQHRRIVTIPNALTLLRLVIVPFFIAASTRGAFDLAFLLFVIAGLTDTFDGWIARRLNQRSTLGAILDPAADKMMMVSGYLIYTVHDGLTRPLPEWLTMTVFARDALIVIFAYLLYTRVQVRRFPPSIAGKVTTTVQVITLSAVIAAHTRFLEALVAPWLPSLFGIAVAATLYSAFDYLRRGDVMVDEATRSA